MDNATANPIYVALLCVVRCVVPLVILFGVSYLLRHFGVIAKPTPPPQEYPQNEEDSGK